ncbi:terminase small subunit [Flavobacterium sp. SUN046]|uniref:terminase small subunit n=1 Tax=Flavobacterium sp. SUN046 TaxID=3002440 RepID=UPI002DBA8A3A|nr:terminase small subunit [Flavobacterium sp. SUN046]MEC4050579.1 terminase small subunit [Flavobacterium sp. SUN046]
MKTNNLTKKQEDFCQAYMKYGDMSAAYREAYKCNNMKPESINIQGFKTFNLPKIALRIKELQSEVAERNKISIDELVQNLSGMVRFDPAEIYDENGALKSIHDIPKAARQMIAELNVDEINYNGTIIGHTKKLKLFDKLAAIEKLMKYLGGYEKHNEQKQQQIQTPDEVNDKLIELLSKLKK